MGGTNVRIISGYGPQENWKLEERMPFFKALEEEVIKAQSNKKAVFIQMDANSKLGAHMIEGDPHGQSENGKILAGIIQRNALHVVNNSKTKCIGKITRRRITRKKKEESIIDFVLGCDEMYDMIEELVIDEKKEVALASFKKTKNGFKTKESDHNTLVTKVKSVWKKKKTEKRIEMYNLKDIECNKKFKEIKSKDNFLSSVFETKGSIEVQTKKFLKRLGYCISICFKKIRVNNSRRNLHIEDLFNKRRILKNKTDEDSFERLKEVEAQLATICASDNAKIIEEACAGLTCEGGGINSGKLWKLKKQLRGITQEPPTAMLDSSGNLVTTNKSIENLTIKLYQERLKPHEIKESLKLHKVQRDYLCEQRLDEACKNKTPPWTLGDIEVVLRQLKNNKSRDPLGFANELFKPDIAGADLKQALLKMCNNIKNQQVFPESLSQCNITSLYKNKGSKKDFGNYRGIFRVTVIRSILDKLIYNDEYDNIDEHLTDSNVGVRRNRNIRDNIFVMNAVLHNVRKRNLKDTDIQIYDAEKCFDKLWSKECFNDIFENGFNNDKFSIM